MQAARLPWRHALCVCPVCSPCTYEHASRANHPHASCRNCVTVIVPPPSLSCHLRVQRPCALRQTVPDWVRVQGEAGAAQRRAHLRSARPHPSGRRRRLSGTKRDTRVASTIFLKQACRSETVRFLIITSSESQSYPCDSWRPCRVAASADAPVVGRGPPRLGRG